MDFIQVSIGLTGSWVRVFGVGLSVGLGRPLFSERNGYRKPILRLGPVAVHVLRKRYSP